MRLRFVSRRLGERTIHRAIIQTSSVQAYEIATFEFRRMDSLYAGDTLRPFRWHIDFSRGASGCLGSSRENCETIIQNRVFNALYRAQIMREIGREEWV